MWGELLQGVGFIFQEGVASRAGDKMETVPRRKGQSSRGRPPEGAAGTGRRQRRGVWAGAFVWLLGEGRQGWTSRLTGLV